MYVHEGRGERIREEECGGERESMEKEEDGEREGGMGDWGRRERRKRKSQEEREGEILDPGACVWVYGQDLLVPFSFSFLFSLFSFLSSLLPSSSLFLSLSSLSSTIPSSSLPFSSLPYPPLPLCPLRYRAGMDNPVIALRFGLLLEMYCRGSPNHMVELQQQVQWIGWAIV